ncbi:MAG: hypothetical protein PHO29_02540 [Acetobacterium sp.]|nr:hypothetical protein [Acetobacterium sp.]
MDSYQVVGERYEFVDCIKIYSYVLIVKGDQYGVLIDGEKLISRPVLSYEAALNLLHQQQRTNYINEFIADLKEETSKIRVSFDLPDREGKKIIIEPVEMEWEGIKWAVNMRTIVSKDKLVNIAEFVTRVLEDLREGSAGRLGKGNGDVNRK